MPTPKLRFKDESGLDFPDWINTTLNKCGLFIRGLSYKKDQVVNDSSKTLVLRSSNIVGDGSLNLLKDCQFVNKEPNIHQCLETGDIVVCLANGSVNLIGKAGDYKGNYKHGTVTVGAFCCIYRARDFPIGKYIFQTSQYRMFLNSTVQGGNGAISNLKTSDFENFQFLCPQKEEQHKIAEFLSTVNEKVEVLEKKLEALNSLKKGFMQRIFSQELRFKDDSGQDFPEWKTKCLGEISERITRKNSNSETDIPLTISAEYGLVNQIEYFNKQIASKDLSKYFLLEKGEFAYNKSYSKGYDFGVIKRLEKYQNGALSSLYICFNVINQDCDFMMYYFDSLKWYKNMPEICQEGARNHGLLNCSVKEFFTIELELPSSKEEQRKIAEFLSAFDEKIEAVKRQVEAMKQVKKGLLQQMFV